MFYKTDIGAFGYDYFYFASLSDLLDHLQECFQCTADEIEHSDAWFYGDASNFGSLFTVHNGNIDKAFCDFHNPKYSVIQYDIEDLGRGDGATCNS